MSENPAAAPVAPTATPRLPFDWRGLWLQVLPPVLGLALLVGIWALVAVGTGSSIPGPIETGRQALEVFSDPFYRKGPNDQGIGWNVLNSLQRVGLGFGLAALVGIPLGFLIGRFATLHRMVAPLISLLKPVSPLAWLPIVTLVVSAVSHGNDGWLPKSFVISAITVTLCSLWPTVINTMLGVAAVDRDLLNVARVLQLSWRKRVWTIVLPAALPLVFTGMRLSLGVGWMVLIAAEMLAQNPGLGKFVWDMFQNGSSQSLALIMVAVFTIGLIGFFLDRVMVALQRSVSFDGGSAS